MPKLLFEIWEDLESHSYEMSPVTEGGDALRRQMTPNAILRHAFHATSDFEAFQMNHDWHGYGKWKPEQDWVERKFTIEEVEAQNSYLAIRKGG